MHTDTTETPASPGPWRLRRSGHANGSVIIEDANREIIGWVTDAAGHTTEAGLPDRRTPAATFANAIEIMLAPRMAAVCALLARSEPISMADIAEARSIARGLIAFREFLHETMDDDVHPASGETIGSAVIAEWFRGTVDGRTVRCFR